MVYYFLLKVCAVDNIISFTGDTIDEVKIKMLNILTIMIGWLENNSSKVMIKPMIKSQQSQ
jgi:hypothetical protein